MDKDKTKSPWQGALNKSLAPGVNAFLIKTAGEVEGEIPEAEQLARLALTNAVQQRVTDVHLEPTTIGWRMRYRIDGRLHDVAQIDPERGQRLIRFFRTLASLDPVAAFLPKDAAVQLQISGHKLDLRLAFAPCQAGDKLAIRMLDPNRVQHRIQDLGLLTSDLTMLQSWMGDMCGMCLVTGPTGSGKTTTLYALVKELDLAHHSLVTIEDPVEYPLDGISQIEINERHGLDFATGLKSMLRLDPDYLLVGEMRDRESTHTAIEAASSGHFLMTTLHSPDCVGVITLLRNWDIADHVIATVLELVINQRLVRRLCPKCRKSGPPTDADKAWFATVGVDPLPEVWHSVGCPDCFNTGYRGRIGVFEIWRRDESDYQLILEHADEHALRRHLRRRGLKSILDDGVVKLREGITSISELQNMGAQLGLLVRAAKVAAKVAAKEK